MGCHVSGRAWLGGLGLACLLVAGCNQGDQIAPVHGRITYNGKPVTVGKIYFFPEHGRPSAGAIAEDGTYSLTWIKPGDGALVGAHKVAIFSTTVGPGSMVDPPKSVEEEIANSKKGASGGKWLVAGKVDFLVPKKYSRKETSPLTANVEKKDNEINFNIPAEK
jgi:hypothetical protein